MSFGCQTAIALHRCVPGRNTRLGLTRYKERCQEINEKFARPSVPCRTSIVREQQVGSDLVKAMSTISATQG